MTLAEVLARLKGVRRSGGGHTALCPAHPDSHNSLSIAQGDKGVLLTCFAGCSVDAICEAIGIKVKDLFPPKSNPKRSVNAASAKPVTVARLATEKRLPVEFLDDLGIEDSPRWNGIGIGYYDLDGKQHTRLRKRITLRAKDGSTWVGKGDLIPYGVWRLREAETKTLLIVEGESDCWSLWYAGYAALGIPGASNVRPLLAEHVEDFERIIVVSEPDSAGAKFPALVSDRLHEVGFAGRIHTLYIGASGFKDISAMWIDDPDVARFRERFEVALNGAPALTAETLKKSSSAETLGRLASSIKPEPVEWLIEGFVPLGKLTLLAGDPGQGKSLVTTELTARVSRGDCWLDGPACQRGNVVILSAEDGASDTIVPRLQAANADLSRIRISGVENLISLPGEIKKLEDVIKHGNVRLIVVDPLNSFLGENINPHQDASVRRALAPLAALAGKTNAAVLVVFHLNKDSGREGKAALYRPTGSIGFVAAARAAFLLAPNPSDANQRMLALLKFNLGPPPPSWAFEIRAYNFEADGQTISTARIEWVGESNLSADDLLRPTSRGPRPDKLEAAKAFLSEMLEDEEWHPSGPIIDAAKASGVAYRTLTDARSGLGILHRKGGFGGGWDWALPTTHSNSAPSSKVLLSQGVDRSCGNSASSRNSDDSASSGNSASSTEIHEGAELEVGNSATSARSFSAKGFVDSDDPENAEDAEFRGSQEEEVQDFSAIEESEIDRLARDDGWDGTPPRHGDGPEEF